MQNLIDQIYKLDSEQLEQVVSAIKLRRNQLHTAKAQSFKIGDTVSFTGRRGRTETGTVTKVKIKYVVVDTGITRWNVPGNMLTRVNKAGNQEVA